MLELVRIGSAEGDLRTLQDILQQLLRFIGNDNSECSDDQVKAIQKTIIAKYHYNVLNLRGIIRNLNDV
jgi:hypothetical protein